MLRVLAVIFFTVFVHVIYAQSISAVGPLDICQGQITELRFQPEANGIVWQKDGNDLPQDTLATYRVRETGSYRVKMKDGKFTNSISITVNAYPKAKFIHNSIEGQCAGTEVKFTNQSTDAASYLWSFGDPESGNTNTSQQKDPNHTFAGTPGNGTEKFKIKLTATSARGGCSTADSSIITLRQQPDGSMGGTGSGEFQGKDYFKICGNVPQGEFTFSNTTSTASTNVDYKIVWGDGSPDFTGTTYNILKHTYKLGTHKMSLIINGKNGCKSTNDYYVFVGTNPSVGLANPGNTAVCSGESLQFPITETANNVPGTVYTLNFNDGSAPVIYIHPNVPSFETHKFDVTSCGSSSSDGMNSYDNSFSASIQAANPCASSSAAIVPIYVSEKPNPNFTISPLDTICVNNIVTLTHLRTANIVDNGKCSAPNSVWKISPATGYTINSGGLGNDFNQNIPSIWQSGSEQLDIRFTQPGTYRVTLRTGSDFCGVNEIVKTICVNPTPAGSFTLDKTEGCGPLTVTAKTNTSALTCGKMRYRWNVEYAPLANCEVKTGDHKFVSGTSETSENPAIAFNNPGTYTLRLMMIAPGNACTVTLPVQTVTVKTKPVIQVSGIRDICSGNTITPIVKTTCSNAETTYSWTFEGGLPATSNSANPGNILYKKAGTYKVTLEAKNECGVTTYSKQIIVKPNPEITLPQDLILCAGVSSGAIAITITPPGSSVSWRNSNQNIGLAPTGTAATISSFTAVNSSSNPAKAAVTFTSSLNGCSDTKTLQITVNPRPATPVTKNIDYCAKDSALQLTATPAAGHTLLWYTAASGGTGSADAPVPSTALDGTTDYFVSQQNISTGCGSERANIRVTVNPIPVIQSIDTANPSTCASSTGSISLKGLQKNARYEVSYTKNGGTPLVKTIVANGSGVLVIDGLTAGIYSDIFVKLSGCPSQKAGPFTLKDPTTPDAPTIGSNSELCAGSNLKLSATAVAGATYSWTGPNGFMSNQQNPILSNATVAANGKYTLAVTKNGCTSTPVETMVTVHAKPARPTVTNVVYCQTDDAKPLQVAPTGVNILQWYEAASGGTPNTDTPVPSTIAAANLTYYVSQKNETTGCESDRAAIQVTVNPVSSITGTDSNNPTSCASATGSITLKGVMPNAPHQVTYNRNGAPVTTTITSDNNGMIKIGNLRSGTYSEIVVTLGNCPSNRVGPITLEDPNPPAAPEIIAKNEICEGADLALDAGTPPAGSVIFDWTGPNGFKSSERSPLISNATPANSGRYSLTITKNNCTSQVGEAIIIVNPLPEVPKASAVNYCIDATPQPLNAIPATGNTLAWYSAALGGAKLALPPTPATTSPGEYTWYVSQIDSKGCESKRTSATVTIHPNAIAEFNPPALIQCPPFTITSGDINLITHPLNNSEYRWFANDVYIGSGSDFPSYTLATENESVRIRLEATSLHGCKTDTVSRTFSTPKLPKPSFELSVSEGCAPLSVNISNTTPDIDDYRYHWTFANGLTSQDAHPGTVVFPANPSFLDTTYFVKLMISSICDTLTKQLPVYVKSKPKALFTPSATEGCSPMKVIFRNTSRGLNTRYHWDFGDGQSLNTTMPEDVEHTFHAGTATDFTVRLIATNECGSDTSQFIISVAPNRIKLNFAMNGPDHSGCTPHTVNFYNNTSGASSFYWDFGDGNFKSTTLGVETVTHTYLKPGKYEVRLLAQSHCNDTLAIDYVTVYPKPVALFKADSYTSCIGNVVSFANESTLATSYLWEFGDGNTSTLADPSHTYARAGTYTVRLTAYRLNAPGSTCTATYEQQIQVQESMPGNFKLSDSTATCAPLTVTFINEISPATSVLWDFGDGTTASGNKVSHTYAYSGDYQPTVTVLTPGGCKYVTTKAIIIAGPSGTFQYSGDGACSPAPVRFEAAAVNTSTYEWDFGDGNTVVTTGSVVFHEYVKPGTYLPSVRLKNGSCSYFIQGKDSVKIDRIDAGFTVDLRKTCDKTVAVFNDTSHVFFGAASVVWNFGDGTSGNGKTVEHEYKATGKYRIDMTVTAASGCLQNISREVDIHVNNTPAMSILADPSACTGLPVSFRSLLQSQDPMNTLAWSISNGVSGSGEVFTHIFTRPGTYRITLTGTTVNGCSSKAVHDIEVRASPVVRASSDMTICFGNTVQLGATGAARYQWAPLEGLSCTDCANPMATPSLSTPYIVSGFNAAGCYANDTVNVTVIQPLKMTSSGNDSICIGQSANLLVSGAASYKWTPANDLSNTTISNPVANPAVTTTYRVVGYDGHNCFTDTAFITVAVGKYPTVDLGPDQVLSTGTILPLSTTITNGPVNTWKWTPATDLDCSDCAVPKAYIKKDISYSVEVTSIYGCQARDTISIKVFCENAQVFIPNGFSPDGDGVNDILMVRAKGIAMVKSFRVFNRWGQLVFERNNFLPNEPSYGWDGKVAGRPGPAEVYVFTAEVICENGTLFTYKGNTTLIK